MSEMSAEKKKEIEKYIIKSYFGGGKNVESLANGADTIKGTDDGYIPQLIVEVTYFGESGIVMIKWNIYGDSRQNSFAMRVCRERDIERNRCDSTDSMVYAWEAWKSRILNKPIFLETNDEDLQKDKRIEELENRLKLWQDVTGYSAPEFYCNDISIRNEELEKEIKTLRAEREVMERHIQELESHNVSLAETNAVLRNSKESYLGMVQTGAGYLKDWEEATGCSKPEHAKKKIYVLENECRVWHDTADHQLEQIHGLEDDISDLYDENKELKSQIEEWKDKTQRCTPFLAGVRLNVLRDNYTRHRNLLFGEVRPEVMVCVGGDKKTIRQYLRDRDFASIVNAINELESEIDDWRKATGCLNPHYAKIKIDAYNSCIGIIKMEKKD